MVDNYERGFVLEALDNMVRDFVQDEETFMVWLEQGVPDGMNAADITDLLNGCPDGTYEEIVDLAARLLKEGV